PRFERGAGGVATRPRTPALDTVVMVFLRSRGALGRFLPSGSYTDEEMKRCHHGGRNLKQEHALRSTAPSPLLPPVGAKFVSAELSHPLRKKGPHFSTGSAGCSAGVGNSPRTVLELARMRSTTSCCRPPRHSSDPDALRHQPNAAQAA